MPADITAIITHYDRPPAILDGAIESVLSQTLKPHRVIVVSDAPDEPPAVPRGVWLLWSRHPSNPYLSWYMAVQRATTKYVAILHDDDRWNPDFLARTLPLLKDHVGFVFSQATVSIDGVEKLNFKGVYGTGVLNARDLIEGMSLQNDIISPSCCVFRRADVLNSLIVGGVPMADYVRGVMAGPDALITMLLAYKYGLAAFVEEPLVTFIGGEDSVTVKSDKQALMQNYAVAFKFARAVYDCARGA